MLDKVPYLNSGLKAIKKRIRKMKFSTRVTLANVFLFTLLIGIGMGFVTLLTNQFLYFKNREDLLNKQLQIEEVLKKEQDTILAASRNDRVGMIYHKLESYYLFDHYKTLIMIIDSDGKTSYGLNKDVYDLLLMDQLKISPQNMSIKSMLEKSTTTGQEMIKVEMFRSINATESVKFQETTIHIPQQYGPSIITESNILGFDTLYTAIRLDTADQYSAFVVVFLYPALDNDFLLSLNSALSISAIIGILFLSIFGKYFTKRALRPLLELSNIAQNMNKEVLNYRIPTNESNDEIDTLIKSLNTMLENLDASFEYQKRFVSDASHELRIPLTIVLGYVELLKTMGTENQALLKESLDAIEDESTHMKNLVEKLLILARLENHRVRVNLEPIKIDDLMVKMRQESLRLYPTHNFVCRPEYSGIMVADMELMTQVFRALSENAVKYSPEGSTITCTCQLKNQYIEFCITDEGQGIAKESIGNLTNRFYRLNEDRNRKTGGTGLGLSIVEALMKAQGGHIRIESTLNLGTQVYLYLPKKNFTP